MTAWRRLENEILVLAIRGEEVGKGLAKRQRSGHERGKPHIIQIPARADGTIAVCCVIKSQADLLPLVGGQIHHYLCPDRGSAIGGSYSQSCPIGGACHGRNLDQSCVTSAVLIPLPETEHNCAAGVN